VRHPTGLQPNRFLALFDRFFKSPQDRVALDQIVMESPEPWIDPATRTQPASSAILNDGTGGVADDRVTASRDRTRMRSRRKRWRMDIDNFVHHTASPGPVFFERSVLDALCGLDRVTPLNESELRMWLSKYQYFPKVFVLPPWKAIYVKDAERDHTFEHAESVNRVAQEWYCRCGYQVVEVPKVSVDERCTFVIQALANSDA
jgi:hypothetical protein